VNSSIDINAAQVAQLVYFAENDHDVSDLGAGGYIFDSVVNIFLQIRGNAAFAVARVVSAGEIIGWFIFQLRPNNNRFVFHGSSTS
jgi:hypothetical protein